MSAEVLHSTDGAEFPSLLDLRRQRGVSLVQAAAALRLSPDVWKKFETGAILPDSLHSFQVERLAAFFEIPPATFVAALRKSASLAALAPPVAFCRRKSSRSLSGHETTPASQQFETALALSQMNEEAKRSWLREDTRL